MQNKNREIALKYAHQMVKQRGLKFYDLVEITDRRFEVHAGKSDFLDVLVLEVFEIRIAYKNA